MNLRLTNPVILPIRWIPLIDYLLRLCDALKPRDLIRIKIKREELAAFMGCSRRTVYRLLSQFKKEGLIGKEGNTLTIASEQRKKLVKKREE
ncbi:MAG: helix-turn-helix domain-containing protein [Holdemania massiliensis]